jgi:hypothetical protein
LEDYANLARRRIPIRGHQKTESIQILNPISKLTRVRKHRVPEDIPYFIKKEDLDEDSLLTIDGTYNPFGQVVLYFEEFTRAVCTYKKEIGRKLIRNMKLTD